MSIVRLMMEAYIGVCLILVFLIVVDGIIEFVQKIQHKYNKDDEWFK